MWTLRYTREVRNYIFDSYPYTEAVWQALKTLRLHVDGRPTSPHHELRQNVYMWDVEGHIVVYERLSTEHELFVTVVKPKE